MSSNEKPIFWASSGRLNEPERILKEQGWNKGSRPAASDFNWLFNTMQKDIHLLKVELKELGEKISEDMKALKESLSADIKTLNNNMVELKSSAINIKKTADRAISVAITSQNNNHVVIHALSKLQSELNHFVDELMEHNPGLKGPGWYFLDIVEPIHKHDSNPVRPSQE